MPGQLPRRGRAGDEPRGGDGDGDSDDSWREWRSSEGRERKGEGTERCREEQAAGDETGDVERPGSWLGSASDAAGDELLGRGWRGVAEAARGGARAGEHISEEFKKGCRDLA